MEIEKRNVLVVVDIYGLKLLVIVRQKVTNLALHSIMKKDVRNVENHLLTKPWRKSENEMNQVYYTNGGGDEQYTPRYGVEVLLPHIKHLKDKIIWCPFDKEDSEFVKVLTENGFKVVYSHKDYGQDFLTYEPENWDIIISNPPYHNKRVFWERALDLKKPFALLLPLNILSDSVINTTMREREREFQLLIPSRRMRFFNKITGETGNQPTFKASYFGVNIFKEQIILQDMKLV